MYYLRLIRNRDVKKGTRVPISKKTFDILFLSRFSWWNPDLTTDLNSQRVEDKIEDGFSDIFYWIINQIIENKLGMKDGKDFEYEDFDYNENEILIDINIFK